MVNNTRIMSKPRMRVLILAYCVSPNRGSEYSVGWNHIRHMSKFCDLTVLYGSAGPHLGDFKEVELYLEQNGEMPNVRFVAVKPSHLARFLNAPNRRGILVYSFYLAYRVWHWQAMLHARRILANEQYSLVHYLGPIGYREPGFLWHFDIPYVWGPIGGMTPTLQLRGSARPFASICKALLKNLANAIQLRFGRRVAKALARADKVVAATSENAEIIMSRFGRAVPVIQENAIPAEWIALADVGSQASRKQPVRLIWVGSLDTRKSPDLLIDALKRVSSKDWQIDIVGDGPLRDVIRSMVSAGGLSGKVNIHGLLARSEVLKLMSMSDVHVITSMNEGNPTVIWEAMARGVPTLSLDHCGMRDTICKSCGVLVPVLDYHQTCEAIAAELNQLIEDPDALARKKTGALACAKSHMWENRANEWLQIYQQAIENYVSNNPQL